MPFILENFVAVWRCVLWRFSISVMGKQFAYQRVVFSHFKRFLSTRGCRVTPIARNYSYCIGNGTSEFFSGGGGAEPIFLRRGATFSYMEF